MKVGAVTRRIEEELLHVRNASLNNAESHGQESVRCLTKIGAFG